MNEQERTAFEAEIRAKLKAEQNAKNRVYKKQWRERNPEKVKASRDRYIIKKAAALMAAQEVNNHVGNDNAAIPNN